MHSRTPRLAAALAAAAIVLVPAAPAAANRNVVTTGDPEVMIGTNTTLTVTGSGWGHGHGMSQWGAQGAALQGMSYDQILAFYYPGTTLGSLGDGKVKVLLTADTDNNLKVQAAPGLKLVDLGRHKKYRLPSARAWKLKQVNGHVRVYRKTGHWHRYRPKGHPYLAGDGQFKSTSSHRVTVKLPSGTREYRGAVRFTRQDSVNVVGLEQYLRGVVPAEVFTSWQPAALQAQAVAARSYAAFERADAAGGYFDVYDSTRSQAYYGTQEEDPSTDAAIAATANRVVTYGGQVAFTQFSSSNGGWTATGSKPYLVAQPDPYDAPASGDPHLTWVKQVPVATLLSAYPALGTLQSVQITDRDGSVTQPDDGWVQQVTLKGTASTVTISGYRFYDLYDLKSAYFSIATP
jgi:SpoIID/LytB domain protein